MSSAFRAAAVIAAGGAGSRLGRPKQMIPLLGSPVLFHSVRAFLAVPAVREIVVATAPENFAGLKREFGDSVSCVNAGATRLASVRSGFSAVSAAAEIIAVHDGARPAVTPALIEECLSAAAECGAAVAAARVKDTIKTSRDGETVSSTLERSQLWAAQTPQCWRREILAHALESCAEGDPTDESQLVEKTGVKVRLVPSTYANLKITTPEDILFAEAVMRNSANSCAAQMRVGFGYDLHRLVAGRPLVLGGVVIPHSKGLLGHSDGDAVLHAVCDAALGAAGAGEIGVYFPPTDLTIMGISSKAIAEKALRILAEKGLRIAQLDVTAVAEEPKLLPHYPAIRKSLSEIFRVPPDRASFKAKSAEGLGEIGKGEAIACHAVVVLEPAA